MGPAAGPGSERERFELFREKVILATGVVGVFADLGIYAVVKPADPAFYIAIGLLFGGLLGVPTTLRADARRRRDEPQ